MAVTLRRLAPNEVQRELRDPVDPETIAQASALLQEVRTGGVDALRRLGERFGDLQPEAPLWLEADQLAQDLSDLSSDEQALLKRVAGRIEAFAQRQRESLVNMSCRVDGGRAGHEFAPVDRAGCYAPGGRFPLPSSVLMTAVTARVAGVSSVVVASPKPSKITRAACAVAGADRLLCVGGAQAVAALAYGVDGLSPVDVIVGPGNRWVTAAKHLVSLHVGIDMLAGPSELLIIADDSADPAIVAADLLGQAEHDPDALPILVTTHPDLVDAVEQELAQQLEQLSTAEIARQSLKNGYAVICESLEQAVLVSDAHAPEHLELLTRTPELVKQRVKHYGGVFVGQGSAEVFGDYGLGPNHVLPTGRSARYRGGLSVLDFMRLRTELATDESLSDEVIADCVALAEMEGLAAHAEAARRRLRKPS